jgi:hypothetical protein
MLAEAYGKGGINILVMVRKQMVSSARQRSCTSVVGGQNYLAKHNKTPLEHPPYYPVFSQSNFLLFPQLKLFLKDESKVTRESLQK